MLRPARLPAALLLTLLSARLAAAQAREATLRTRGDDLQVPLPEAVRAAYCRLPVANRTDDQWTVLLPEAQRQPADTLYEVSYTVTRFRAADTLSYDGFASFTSQGRQRGSSGELPANSLPWWVRWRLRYDSRKLHRELPGIGPALVVARFEPYALRRRNRTCYTILFGRLGLDRYFSIRLYGYYRNGAHPYYPKFRN